MNICEGALFFFFLTLPLFCCPLEANVSVWHRSVSFPLVARLLLRED